MIHKNEHLIHLVQYIWFEVSTFALVLAERLSCNSVKPECKYADPQHFVLGRQR